MSLQLFPRLTNEEFNEACSNLVDRFRQHSHEQVEWLSVEAAHGSDISYTTITKELHCESGATQPVVVEFEHDEMEQDDDEALDSPAKPTALVRYDILLSPVYCVPVLYFSIMDSQHRFPPTMDTLYQHVITSHFKAQVENSGVIGGITVNDHPITNKPVFFIHPCQTAEMMQASVGNTSIRAAEYLIVWIGALGKCVGLHVPLALVRRDGSI